MDIFSLFYKLHDNKDHSDEQNAIPEEFWKLRLQKVFELG